MKIVTNTIFTTYNADVAIKPKSHLWFIRNTGSSQVILNNGFVLAQLYQEFGIDTTDILLPALLHYINTGEKIKVENQTQFNIAFGTPINIFAGLPAKQFLLVETFIKIVRDGLHIQHVPGR